MPKRDQSETFLERIARLAAKQGIAISNELHLIIERATEEVAALDKRLMERAGKMEPKKARRSKAKTVSRTKGRARTKKAPGRPPDSVASKASRSTRKARASQKIR